MLMKMDNIFRIFAAVISTSFLMSATAQSPDNSEQPDIILILTDDMGWNDVSFHGSDQILTPNLDVLAYEGTILHQYYTHPICTPTRSALLTGHYASSTGLQGSPLSLSETRALPRRFRLLPAYLRDLGYKTHLVGKWHVGAARPGDLPTARGFDSHFGFRGGLIDYYEYDLIENVGNGQGCGFNFFRNATAAKDLFGYATHLLTDEAVHLIEVADKSPLFMMLAYNAPHSGNEGALLQAPAASVRSQRKIQNLNRRYYSAVVKEVDKGVGSLLEALGRSRRLERTVIVFATDNGAPNLGMYWNEGSNWPLRGMKETAWEGGVRVPAFIWGVSVPARKRFDHLFHVSDWLPTFYSIAGGDPTTLPVEGLSQWEAIKGNAVPPRTDILLDYDDLEKAAALRDGDLKIVLGQYQNGIYDGYFGESGEENRLDPEEYASELRSCAAASAIAAERTLFNSDSLRKLRDSMRIECDTTDAPKTLHNCTSGCVFDIRNDPCETTDLSKDRPEDRLKLKMKIDTLIAKAVPSLPHVRDPLSDPKLHDGVWIPWLQDEDEEIPNN